MSGTSLEHQTCRSQTAIALSQSLRGGEKKKSPQAHSITGLPTAVALTGDEMCENKIFVLQLSFILFLRQFAAFQTDFISRLRLNFQKV